MKRATFALALVAATAGLLPVPAFAADVPYRITIDGRPLTPPSKPSGAFARSGVMYVDIVVATKAFSGLLTFGRHGQSARVSIHGRHAEFVVGRASADFNGSMRPMNGAPFVMNGDLFVPLATFAVLAKSKIAVDPAARTASLTTSS